MKTVYCFMIGLILFNFYACTKQQIQDPTNLSVSSKLEITYLDENDNPTENRTDDILMKLEEDDSGFIMVSRKTGEEEYTASLIDMVNNTSISMIYTNGASFPHKIILVKDKETMTGYTSIHRQDSQDFDIIWYYSDGDGDICENIPLKTTIYNHIKTAGFDNNTNYQIQTLKVSVRIADAINKYVEENYEDNSMLRRISWKSFCNFWKKVIKPIMVVITVIVAIIAPTITPILVGVIKHIDEEVKKTEKLISQVEDFEAAASGNRELFILKTKNDYSKSSMYANNENIYLNKDDIKSITFDVTEASIGKFELWLSIPDENPDAESGMISGYYKFEYNRDTRCFLPSIPTETTTPNTERQAYLSMDDFNNNSDFNLIIKRLANSVRHDVYIDIKLEDNIFVNKLATDSFQLILQKDFVE